MCFLSTCGREGRATWGTRGVAQRQCAARAPLPPAGDRTRAGNPPPLRPCPPAPVPIRQPGPPSLPAPAPIRQLGPPLLARARAHPSAKVPPPCPCPS
eukprot:291466-Chlamydomonas_euryale.AAC.1